MWVLSSLLVALVLASACGNVARTDSERTYKIATSSSQVNLTAQVSGLLQAQANDDGTACVWFEDGPSRMALVWPLGYSARGNPLSVLDGTGHIVATAGQSIQLGGGLRPDSSGGDPVTGCTGTLRAWIVGEIVTKH